MALHSKRQIHIRMKSIQDPTSLLKTLSTVTLQHRPALVQARPWRTGLQLRLQDLPSLAMNLPYHLRATKYFPRFQDSLRLSVDLVDLSVHVDEQARQIGFATRRSLYRLHRSQGYNCLRSDHVETLPHETAQGRLQPCLFEGRAAGSARV